MHAPYREALMAAALILQEIEDSRSSAAQNFSLTQFKPVQEKTLIVDGEAVDAGISKDEAGYSVAIGAHTHEAQIAYQPGDQLAHLNLDGQDYQIKVSPANPGYRLRLRGMDVVIQVLRRDVGALYHHMPEPKIVDTSNLLLCPMPGLVVKLMVAEGDTVEEGQSLAIIEAMKMENILRAEKAATVKRLPVAEGESLSVDDIIMEFE